ncbi:hypothetical protein TNCV_149901 [Trichonephila clavipes]|nr:hypothetical protein TNCV_149901 [Trichonephila clavipes]
MPNGIFNKDGSAAPAVCCSITSVTSVVWNANSVRRTKLSTVVEVVWSSERALLVSPAIPIQDSTTTTGNIHCSVMGRRNASRSMSQ